MELISIIVPIYKVERYLERCIQSIVNQTYNNLEIILVDDGSPDSCPTICDKWANKDSRIKVIHKQNGGLSDARNAGMAIATGDYVGFVDSDDWIAQDMYLNLYKAMQTDHSDIAACAVEMVWDNGSPNRPFYAPVNCTLAANELQSALLEEKFLKHPVWYKLYRFDIICDIPFEVGKVHEDVFWTYQAIENAKKISFIDYVGYYYRQRSDSIMGAEFSLNQLDMIEALYERYLFIFEHHPELESAAKCNIWTSCLYCGQMSLLQLPKDQQRIMFEQLRSYTKKTKLQYKDYASLKFTHRVWFSLARCSLKMVCMIKNILKIGV